MGKQWPRAGLWCAALWLAACGAPQRPAPITGVGGDNAKVMLLEPLDGTTVTRMTFDEGVRAFVRGLDLPIPSELHVYARLAGEVGAFYHDQLAVTAPSLTADLRVRAPSKEVLPPLSRVVVVAAVYDYRSRFVTADSAVILLK